ncbi:unnamed protein product [Peronospora destructor]|uniref:Uncharacterized protein n=1 Tax=Peronospora destructor TaxID=86335 RepID=A0AAV0UAD6_9STRA|nr:unnamed protein product [Peronospora destructor]
MLLQSPQGFALSVLQSEAVVAAAVGGAITGATLSGIERQVRSMSSDFSIFSFVYSQAELMAVAKTFVELLVGRVVVCVEIGCSSVTVPLYIAEASPPQIRRQLVSLYSASITGGQCPGCVVGDTEKGWSKGKQLDDVRAALLKIRDCQEVDVELQHIEVSNHGPWAAWPVFSFLWWHSEEVFYGAEKKSVQVKGTLARVYVSI